MNYNKLFERGSMYVAEAASIWSLRKAMLMTEWVTNIQNRDKIDKLINELQFRISELSRLYWQAKENLQNQKIAEAFTPVQFQCADYFCRMKPGALISFMPIKKYLETKPCCNICGKELQPEGCNELFNELAELGISPQT